MSTISAAPVDSVAVRIGYLPAYYLDCGWSGTKCRMPAVSYAGHSGDSEAVILDLVQDGGVADHAGFSFGPLLRSFVD